MTGWETVGAQDHAEANVPYRTTFWCAGYAWPFRGAIAGACRAAQALGTAFNPIIRVTGHEIFSEADSPTHASVPTNELPRGAFVVRVTWEKHGSGTLVIVLVAIIALIIVGVAGWVIIAKVTEKQFTQVMQAVGGAAKSVLSPGFVVAAMVVAVVALTHGGKQ